MQSNEEVMKALGMSKPSMPTDIDESIEKRQIRQIAELRSKIVDDEESARLQTRKGAQQVILSLGGSLALMRQHKPNDRSEQDRYWAIAITDMEKVVAIFKTYCT